MKRQSSRQIFEKYSNIKFRENPSSLSRFSCDGVTDRRDEKTDVFREFVTVPVIVYTVT